MAIEKQTAIYPGKPWLDTNGNRIHAHGGSILFVDDTFYWYGENKEKTVVDTDIWHWGVRLYSSKDLYNWTDEGIIMMPETEDVEDPMHYTQYMDRPHIIYNEMTKKFVMWMKIMNNKNMMDQYMVIATADSIKGPFTKIDTFHPLDMSSGDFDLVVDPKTKKAFIYFDKVHTEMICAELTDDYTNVTGQYSSFWHEPFTPLVREAPAFLERNGKMYLLTSATTGYLPNPTEYAVSDNYFGPWEEKGIVHENDVENLSFRSQISGIFKHPHKKDLYIAVADRWIYNIPDDIPHDFYEQWVKRKKKDPNDPYTMDPEVFQKVWNCREKGVRNISLADYVWLPIEWDGDRPVIRWYDSWKIEDYE